MIRVEAYQTHIRRSTAAVIASGAVLLSLLPAQSTAATESVSEAVDPDELDMYVQDHRVSTAEATARLEFEGEFTSWFLEQIDEEDESFSWAHIDHESKTALVVLVLGADTRNLANTIPPNLQGKVELRADGHFSYSEAGDLVASMHRSLKAAGAAPELIKTDPRTGRVTVRANTDLSGTEIEGLFPKLDINFEHVSYEVVDHEDTHPVGGSRLYKSGNYGNYCTNGFTMRQISTGTRGFVSAGHCLDDGRDRTQNESGATSYATSDIAQVNDSRGDFGYNAIFTSNADDNFVYREDSLGNVYTRDPVTLGLPYSGQYICRFGITTERQCDNVLSSQTVCVEVNCHQIRMENDEASGGDSGGPWWDFVSGTGTVQYGIHEGGSNGRDNWTVLHRFDDTFPNVEIWYD